MSFDIIVKQHGGTFDVDTEPGEFTDSPIVAAGDDAGRRRRQRRAGMTATILVVDDEPDLESLMQQRFRRQIRGGDFDFRFARDGVEALEMLANGAAVDMVVSDINMPRMDGLTLLQKIRRATISSRRSSSPPMATWPTSAPR